MNRSGIGFLFGSLLSAWLGLQTTSAQAQPIVGVILSPHADETNYNGFISTSIITNADGSNTGDLGLISITNNSESLPFNIVVQTPLLKIYAFQFVVPADVLSKTYTLTWNNYSTGTNYSDAFTAGGAEFIVSPQSQSVFVGNTVSFAAQAYHTSGYQWQLNGTNLVADGHVSGVTNATLTITNVQLSDAGDYTVIASHPTNPASFDATLRVYKPIQLALAALPAQAGYELLVANQDHSPFEPARIPNLQVYSTADLTVDFSAWNIETNTGSISNGMLRIDYPGDGSSGKYWRITEQ
jgi:hypothetical protein